MSADAKPGSKAWKRAMRYRMEPTPIVFKADPWPRWKGIWLCQLPHPDDWRMTCGAGKTPDEAYVDFVEEATYMTGGP